MCVGQHLAKLEMNAIFCALAARVERFHIQQETRSLNNVLRGFSKLMVSVELAAGRDHRHQGGRFGHSGRTEQRVPNGTKERQEQ